MAEIIDPIPGPYGFEIVEPKEGFARYYKILSADDEIIAQVYNVGPHPAETCITTARLLASSYELLETLVAFMNRANGHLNMNPYLIPEWKNAAIVICHILGIREENWYDAVDIARETLSYVKRQNMR